MRRVGVALTIMAACSGGADTAQAAAQRYVAAWNAGDSGAIYDMLVERERRAWEELAPSLPGGTEAGLSPRQRFAGMILELWGDNRGSAEVVRVEANESKGVAVLKLHGNEDKVALVREDGGWWISLGAP
jgi:hypothetical protein